ncbi:transposase, IS4 family [Shewanella denitrificans OS217]|uniref:Transposase, IS4 family n=1 Tax=Shewanella denitrificans (strain OS217 / ATCC BAA-1090 / DSM 15013) TaxID=318161 RepID=Q12LE0_SHEDO|nr:IS982-like element ISSde7 family transposase [Shewanella denitrificans]ABE55736.1 transposase, IS4 family [Shewanella denitrificans OS217]
MDNLVDVFCDVDDFCAVFMPQWKKQCVTDGTRKRQRSSRMDMSEIMTIIILFHTSHHRDFKNYYTGYLARFFKSDFPHLLSYTRFLELMPTAVVPLCSYFSSIRSLPTGIEFVDSTSVKVCHNLRIPRHKTLSGLARRGKGTMGWFYGFKLHLIVNHKGGIVAAKITPANTHDTKPVSGMVVNAMDKLYADKGYISKALASELLEQGVTLVNNVRKNMKKKVLSLWDRAMLSRRFIIETINDQLKNISQIEHSRHRSVHGFMLNMIGGLIAYQLKESKPQLNITDVDFNAISVMA